MRAKVWIYPGVAAWHFVTLPKGKAQKIRTLFGEAERGWRSLPVRVIVGGTAWRTSIFMDTKAGSYLLPLKAAVRRQEKIQDGKTISFSLEILA
jgi:hypothetical protein